MDTNAPIKLRRDCEALLIPSGEKVTLNKDSSVVVTQALGGSYTVMTERGFMARISGKDADALGEEVVAVPAAPPPGSVEEVEKLVWEQLKTVFDPEIPMNVVELGLVYLCYVSPNPEGGFDVKVN